MYFAFSAVHDPEDREHFLRKMPAGAPALLRAYPSPAFQTCFVRIRYYVLHGSTKLFAVPNQSVVIFTLPKGPTQPEFPLRFSSRERLPRMHHLCQVPVTDRAEDDVSVVRHNAPREKFIMDAVKCSKGAFDGFRNFSSEQVLRAQA